MSWDYGTYYQPWWEIAHGHLNPITTVVPGGFPFWQSDGEFIVWLLAPFYWILPSHKLGFWWLQDVAYVGISAVCYHWIRELLPGASEAAHVRSDQAAAAVNQAGEAPVLRIVGSRGAVEGENLVAATCWLVAACLLVFNPWTYWSASFAFQIEPFGALFALLAVRALTQRRQTVWLWCVLTALCGSASTIYLIGVGLAGLATEIRIWYAARRHHTVAGDLRRAAIPSVTVVVGAVAWLLVLGAIHATRSISERASSIHQGLSYLLGSHGTGGLALAHVAGRAVLHPGTVVSVIASHALNLWANTSPGGFVGLLSVPGFFLSAPTLLENSLLKNQDFSYPGFSNLIVYPALAVGTALVVAAVLRRRRTLGLVLAGLVIANCIAWFAIWLPKTGDQYVRIAPAAAMSLRQAAKRIPQSDQVIASQGFVGVFAARRNVFAFGSPRRDLAGPEVFPVRSRVVWFALSANQGIEGPSTAATFQALGSISALPGASFVSSTDGIWIFRWRPAAGVKSVALGGSSKAIPAWITGGSASRVQRSGRIRDWTLTAKPAAGYVVSGDIWRLGQGRYAAEVSLSSTALANIEIWNDGTDSYTLLARRRVRSARMRTVAVPFTVPKPESPSSSAGTAPFSYEPQPPPRLSNVEIRIWTPGTGTATVTKLRIRRVPT